MSIPFSERVHNWVSSLVAIWPLILALVGGTVYGNSESVRTWIHGADDIVPSEQGFNEQVIHAIEKINEKLAELESEIARANANSRARDTKNHDSLKADLVEIQRLVN
jgi:hypothetical protein